MLSPGALEARSAAGLAAEISRLVTDGTLAPGERLPTVRDMAAELGLSTGTIAAAWRALAQAGVVTSRGRSGTFVRAERRDWLSPRVRGMAVDRSATPPPPSGLGGRGGHGIRLDLSLGTPDPAMLPSLERALAGARPRADTGRYHDLPVLPDLHDVLAAEWPVGTVEALTVVDGALDGISRAVEQVVRFGDRVAVESPGFPYIYDLIDATGGIVLPLESDADGILPASLARALAQRPSTLVLQTRAQNPTGVSMSGERARRLAEVLLTVPGGRAVTVIEDDHSALIATPPAVTLARWIPAQVVHVRGFQVARARSAYRRPRRTGPDRRTDRSPPHARPGWTSRPAAGGPARTADRFALLDRAGAHRPSRLPRSARPHGRGLRRLGIDVGAPDGINLWVPVRDERAAVVYLAAEGIAVAAGGRSSQTGRRGTGCG